ncbi:OmpP1/FadL family transporter [Pseudovibrio denitrificans]|uniref:OmpP1/FadL family transporter n=1 Tax=Pseudovibrio denitrificans TaxID=258256 RepID=UPI0039BFA921
MRVLKNAGRGLAAGCFVLAGSDSALAGAWDTMGVGSLDLLFAPEKFVVEGGTTYLDRNVDYKVTKGTTQGRPGTDVDLLPNTGSKKERVTPNIWNYQIGVKATLLDNVDCLGRAYNPFRITEEMDPSWAGRYAGYETNANTLGLDATCSYKFQVGEGQSIRAIAGVKALDLTYQSDGMLIGGALLTSVGSAPVVIDPAADYVSGAELKSKGMAWGWRAGVSYEIPAYALRASLVYDSAISMDLEGDSYVKNVPLQPTVGGGMTTVEGEAYSSLKLPQSVELNIQSGIAPGWLATFGVKWMDWSVIDRLVVTNADGNMTTNRVLNFKDGWTVKAGIGHKLNDKLSLGSSVQWDKGVGGSYSDTYAFGLGGSYALNDKVKVIVGGAAIYKTPGSGDANNLASGATNEYEYDSSWNYALNTKLRIAF